MKYIIWGSGIRGKKVLELVEKQKISAYVDMDSNKVGQLCEQIEILNLDEAERKFPEDLYVITPIGHEKEVEEILKARGIKRFIRLGNDALWLVDTKTLGKYTWDIPKDICYLYGVNLRNMVLYDFLKKECVERVVLIAQEDVSVEAVDILSEKYEIVRKEEVPQNVKIIFFSEKEKKIFQGYKNAEQLIYILHRGLPVYNEKLQKFKKIHSGKRCFIVATGPSLKVSDLDILHKNGAITISMNRIYNIFSKTEWRPDYYVVQDAKAIEDLADEIAELKLPYKFISSQPEIYWENKKAVETSMKFELIAEHYREEYPSFSNDICRGVFEGYTVTYACLQIAAYMGFSEIYLLGVDFSYTTDVYSDQNHFEGYRSEDRPVRLNEVHPELVALAYEKAKLYGEEQGIKIYNATRGGKLEIFPRVDFDTLFPESM